MIWLSIYFAIMLIFAVGTSVAMSRDSKRVGEMDGKSLVVLVLMHLLWPVTVVYALIHLGGRA